MPDSRSRRFATWAFSFKPLGGNLRIAAATHISAFFVPKSRNRERTHPAGSPAQANRDRAASRRAFGGPHPAGEPKPRKSVTSFESLSLGEVFYPRNHGKRSLQLGEVPYRRSHGKRIPQGDPQLGKPAARKPSSRDSRTTPKAILQAPAMPRFSGRTPKRR